jgi:Tfp pilus assembly PilM family ATPase
MKVTSKHGWVGFDIGATSVKAAQLVRKDGVYEIRSAALVSRKPRWTTAKLAEDKPLTSADELRSAGSMCEHLAGNAAAAVLPAALCDIIQMDAPTGKRHGSAPDLLRAVEAETHRSMRDHVYDTWPVTVQNGKINVVAAPRAWSDQISADVAAGGWNCQVIDALPWALARAASLVAPHAEGLYAALDWGYGKTTMCLVRQGVPALVRSLKDCAFQDVLDAVSQRLRLDQRDAEILLRKHGLEMDETAETLRSYGLIEDLLAEPVTRLVQEIRRTIGYWQGITRGKTPEAIYLFGGGGTLAGVDRRLSEMLGTTVESWTLPIYRAGDADAIPPACLLGAAAGLSALAWEAP